MFATVEEAEQAAALLRRFGGGNGTIERDTFGWKVDPGEREPYLHDWEQVADFLLAQQDLPREGHTGDLVEARAFVALARARLGGTNESVDAFLVSALEALLEVLG